MTIRYLLDTCVISETRKPEPDKDVVRFLRNNIDVSALSIITIGEVIFGVARLEDSKLRKSLLHWLEELKSQFSEAILPTDINTARHWGEIRALCMKKGAPIPVADALIAATAKQHGLTLVTRNTKDFRHTGVTIHNPWN